MGLLSVSALCFFGGIALGLLYFMGLAVFTALRNFWKFRKMIRTGNCRLCGKFLIIWPFCSDICSYDCIRAEKVISSTVARQP
jgi:hypothetical protein